MNETITYYGVIREIILLNYYRFQYPLFKCDQVNIFDNKGRCKNDEMGNTMVNMTRLQHGDRWGDDPFIPILLDTSF